MILNYSTLKIRNLVLAIITGIMGRKNTGCLYIVLLYTEREEGRTVEVNRCPEVYVELLYTVSVVLPQDKL